MSEFNYHEQEKQKNSIRLRSLLSYLPPFAFEFFRGIEPTTSPKTRIGYAYDLRIFFEYILKVHPSLKNKNIKDLEIKDLEAITPDHIEMFLEYLSYYTKPHPQNPNKLIEYQNDERGKARKLAAVRTFFSYFYKKRKISINPSMLVEMPKIHEKNIVRLEVDEVAKLLDEVENGEKLTTTQKRYHNYTKLRDLALITVLLGTGIRVSECVGLNIEDIDFNVNGLKITRKGGNEMVIYFGEEVEEALNNYLEERLKKTPKPGHERALFLSLQNRRITVRSVQNLVKKYASLVTKLKKISPHKLRSTYGTNLYQETGDIYLVADVLGHKDVNTTRKHYAQIDDQRRRSAAKAVKLRKI
ncbi:tyrosine-type recombinase/integrase [Defluviitalea phaphyphila]|uniref:tyrosine-type recombinase/integrase n=1 Tax=Defluviitalea phaphyphila TaxID=1473580 RepID=UPI000730099E|nr:tyrosine-type recombinase/integrase [Defluviitalea phaphyphila]